MRLTAPEQFFGWAIGTSSQEAIEAHAQEAGFETNGAFWDEANAATLQLEGNVMRVLRNAGFQLRDEGHDGNGDLVGSGWVCPQGGAWRHYRKWLTANEIQDIDALIALYPGAYTDLVRGVGPLMVDILSPTIEVWQDQHES